MQQPRVIHMARLVGASLLAGLLAATAAPGQSHAEQFVLFDVTFDYTKMQADTSTPSKSHFYVKGNLINPDRPTNWVSPVDYRNGTVHIRTEVFEKPPGGERTEWTLCYIPNRGQGNGYGCTGSGIYTEKGLYERDVSMTSWWENQSIIWTEGIKQMDLVIKDGSGGNGHAHRRPDHEKFFPTRMRITMVQVSAGAKYDPSRVPNLVTPAADAGAPADPSPPPDAAAVGPGGTGGAGGSGNPGAPAPTPAPGPEPGGTPGSGPTGPPPTATPPPAGPAPGGTPAGPPGSSTAGAPPATPAPVSGSGCSAAPHPATAPAALLLLATALVFGLARPRRRPASGTPPRA